MNASTEEVAIPGYVVCSRRDRHEGDNRGGIMTLRREDFNGIVHITNTDAEERSWHFIQSGIDSILLANWYRPGASSHDGFSVLYKEVADFFPQVSGVIIMGDLNIHHKRWLRHSREDSTIGGDMKTFCDFHGFTQLVKEPTRNEYLLDLAITDIGGAGAKVLPRIADHNGVLVTFPLSVINESAIKREMWILKDANWKCLIQELKNIDWTFLNHGTAEDAVNLFQDILWTALIKYIPRKEIICKRSSHPWINDRCKRAIFEKTQAEGSENYESKCKDCSDILLEERQKYVNKLKEKLSSLSRSSKQWWRINRELMHRKMKISSIPPLRDENTWILDAKGKANAFAKVFTAKNELPEELVDTPFFGHADTHWEDFIPLRSRCIKKIFKKLNSDTATGHDKISK